MTETLPAEVIMSAMIYFGGPAAIIAIASIISAYNQWKTRRILTKYLQETARR